MTHFAHLWAYENTFILKKKKKRQSTKSIILAHKIDKSFVIPQNELDGPRKSNTRRSSTGPKSKLPNSPLPCGSSPRMKNGPSNKEKFGKVDCSFNWAWNTNETYEPLMCATCNAKQFLYLLNKYP